MYKVVMPGIEPVNKYLTENKRGAINEVNLNRALHYPKFTLLTWRLYTSSEYVIMIYLEQ